MHTLRICDIGLAQDTSHALHSMLKVLAGRTIASWRLAPIESADVLIAHPDSRPDVIAEWNGRGRPVVLLVDDDSEQAASPFVLRRPLRVMPLLGVLDLVAEQWPGQAKPSQEPCANWIVAESIRALTEGGAGGWHVARTASSHEVWVRDGHAHATAGTFDRLRRSALPMGRFSPATSMPPAGLAHMSLHDLGWFIGLHGPAGLAPWLSRDVSYSLRRWPDFGRLGASPETIQLSAITAAQARTPIELVELSHCDEGVVQRFLTATSLAGLLVVRQPVKTPADAPRQGAWTRLVGDLRRHLRLFS